MLKAEKCKYLGIIINEKHDLREHVKDLAQKC